MSPTEKCPKQLRWECSSCSPNLKLETPCLYPGTACDRRDTTERLKLLPIPKVVWQQPPETITNQCYLSNNKNDSTKYCTQETSKTTVTSQSLQLKGIEPQNYLIATDYPPGNQTGNKPVSFVNCSKNNPTDNQKSEQHVKTTLIGDTAIPLLSTTTPLIEEGLVRDEQTNEVYLSLTSTVVLKENKKCCTCLWISRTT